MGHTRGDAKSASPTVSGYVKATWADWTILPALNVVNDALMTGDLETLARPLLADIVSTHLCACAGLPITP